MLYTLQLYTALEKSSQNSSMTRIHQTSISKCSIRLWNDLSHFRHTYIWVGLVTCHPKKNNQYQYCLGMFKAMPWFLYVIFWTRVFFRTDTCMSVWKCIPLSLCDFLCVRVKRVHTFLMYMYVHVLYCAPLPLRPITTQLPQLQSSYGKLHCNIYCCMTPS